MASVELGVQRLVESRHSAAGRHPGLGLRGSPVGEVELGIVAAGDPRLAAAAKHHRLLAPGVAAGFLRARDGVEAPLDLPGLCVERGDEAAFLLETVAAVQALNEFPFDDDGAGGRAVALGRIGEPRFPHSLARARVEGDDARVARRHEELVFEDRQVAHGPALVGTGAILPDQFPGPAISAWTMLPVCTR